MEPPGGRDSRFNLGYSMNLLSGEAAPEIYNPTGGRPSTSLQQLSPRHHAAMSGGCNRKADCYDDRGGGGGGMTSQQMVALDGSGDLDDAYGGVGVQAKKSPPSNGKKTKGRVKIKMEYIENKLRRYTTFSKRKTGIMKKAYELSTLTGTQVMLLVASETGHVYTFATRKLQPMITSEAGKALIQTCLNSPDPPAGAAGGDQRMSATGFEETELTYNISDEDSKDENMSAAGNDSSADSCSDVDCDPDLLSPPSGDLSIKNSQARSSTPKLQTPTSSSNLIQQQQQQQQQQQTSTAQAQTQILSPLVYQTAQGMMYAATSSNGGGVILGLTQGDSTQPQYIIPLSMLTTNRQGELDLTKRK